jgi:hypothetical protein
MEHVLSEEFMQHVNIRELIHGVYDGVVRTVRSLFMHIL